VKYLGCLLRCRLCVICDIHTSSFVRNFCGVFNSIMHVLGHNEMVAVQLDRSYCLPSLLYGCEIWHTRSGDACEVSKCCWKKCLFSENVILQTLARCCCDNTGAICDVYKFTSKDLMDLPIACLKRVNLGRVRTFLYFVIACMCIVA